MAFRDGAYSTDLFSLGKISNALMEAQLARCGAHGSLRQHDYCFDGATP
jgi:hypothetical protein